MFSIFDSAAFMPHGHCYLWQPGVLWLHVVSNSLVALAYFTIPAALIVLVKKRSDLTFNRIFVLFAIFILACGTTHIMDIITVWHPYYWLDGLVRALTALASVLTAILVWPLIPKALSLRSSAELAKLNQELQEEVRVRKEAEEALNRLYHDLENLIEERTQELAKTNLALKAEVEERKLTAEKFDKQREWFGAILSSIADGVMATNVAGQIEFVNQNALSITGISLQEVQGKKIIEIFSFDDAHASEWDENKTSQGAHLLERPSTPNFGTHRRPLKDIESSSAPIKNSQQEIIGQVIIFRDVSEQKTYQEAQARLAALVECSDDAIIALDLSGRITDWNRGAESIFGFQPHEIIGQSIELLFAPNRQSDFTFILNAISSVRKVRHHETERKRKNGEIFHASISVSPIYDKGGNLVGIAKIARDITEEKDIERKILRWQYLFTHANWAFALIKPKDLVFETVNHAFSQMLGYEDEELVDRPLDLFLKEPCQLKNLADAMASYGNHSFEIMAVRKDGSQFPAFIHAHGFRDSHDQQLFWAMSVQDISARRLSEQKINDMLRELLRSNADLEQFSYIASHDLQEPLRKMSIFSQLLTQDYAARLDAEGLSYLGFIADGARRMQTMIDDLLEFSRIGIKSSAKKALHLNDILREASDNLSLQIKEQKAVIIADNLPEVYADASDMLRIFQNLLGNALKYHAEAPPIIRISCERMENEWRFCFADNGIGIDPRHLEIIFVIFKRLHAKNKYPGTGIGLAMVKKIVERHGGRIWAESSGSGGTSFYFTMPCDESKTAPTLLAG